MHVAKSIEMPQALGLSCSLHVGALAASQEPASDQVHLLSADIILECAMFGSVQNKHVFCCTAPHMAKCVFLMNNTFSHWGVHRLSLWL